ncbi:MAG: response regulator transcription factor [Arcobacter sp.]|nr:response regulator transcription factor [Arcobacter sp.]
MDNNSKEIGSILKKLNILYIEDEEEIRKNLKKTLDLLCNKTFDVDCIEKAEETITNNRIDIIISDINLPKSNGLNFVKNIRTTNKDIPVIIISAYTEKDFLMEATKLKLIDYLVKPIDFKVLYGALSKCVEDIVYNSKYIINLQNGIQYNVLEKKLFYTDTDKEILLTSKELHLLDELIKNSNKHLSNEELKNLLWEDPFDASDSALKNLLTKLRKKIGKNSIKNLSGIGYQIVFS